MLRSVWRWVTCITPPRLCQEDHPPALRTDSIRTHLPAFRCSSLGELSCASPVYASCTLRRRRWPLAGFLWCFVLLQLFCCFICSPCCRSVSVFLDCAVRDCSFDLGTMASPVLRCLHLGRPHHPVGPVLWVSPSPARERQALMSWSLACLALRDIASTIRLIHKEPFHCAHF